MPTIPNTSRHQHQHRKASTVYALLMRDGHAASSIYVRIPSAPTPTEATAPSSQMHPWQYATLSTNLPKAVYEPHRLPANKPARLHCKQRKSEWSMLWGIISESHPTSLLCSCPDSRLGSLSSCCAAHTRKQTWINTAPVYDALLATALQVPHAGTSPVLQHQMIVT